MKRLLIIFFIILVLIVSIPVIFLVFGIQSNPLITHAKKLDYEDVNRVKKLMRENNPRRLKDGEIKQVEVTERDLNLFLDYGLSEVPGNQQVYAHVNLRQNAVAAQFTYKLPQNAFGNYLNVTTLFVPDVNRLDVKKLKIGSIGIPGWLINFVAGLSHRYLLRYEEYRNVVDLTRSMKDIEVDENKVAVVYQWHQDLIKELQAQGRNFLMPEEERKRLRIYNEKLAMISRPLNGRTVSLIYFLKPMFDFAYQRTQAGAIPEAENRALILNLAAFSVGRNIGRFIDLGNAKPSPSPRKGHVKLVLVGRDDLAKHFLVSAALTVSAGSGLANLAGVFKEMDDSQGGSGFSFADLTADRAGVKLGELAGFSSQKAKLLQQRMQQINREADFMPRINNLPEGIQELEFKRVYRDLDSKTYKMVENEIDRRIAACWLYKH